MRDLNKFYNQLSTYKCRTNEQRFIQSVLAAMPSHVAASQFNMRPCIKIYNIYIS